MNEQQTSDEPYYSSTLEYIWIEWCFVRFLLGALVQFGMPCMTNRLIHLHVQQLTTSFSRLLENAQIKLRAWNAPFFHASSKKGCFHQIRWGVSTALNLRQRPPEVATTVKQNVAKLGTMGRPAKDWHVYRCATSESEILVRRTPVKQLVTVATEAIWVQQNDVVKEFSKVNKSDVSLATSHSNVLFVEHLHCKKCHVKSENHGMDGYAFGNVATQDSTPQLAVRFFTCGAGDDPARDWFASSQCYRRSLSPSLPLQQLCIMNLTNVRHKG